MKPCPQKGEGRKQGKKCLWFPPSSSSKNDVNAVCSILELLGLHIGKQELSLLAYVGHRGNTGRTGLVFLAHDQPWMKLLSILTRAVCSDTVWENGVS